MKYWILLFCLMLGIRANAQAFHSSSANLYTWGKRVTEVKDNFENLENNVTLYGDKRLRIKMLKYEECGVLKSSSQMAEIIRYNYLHAPGFLRSISYESRGVIAAQWKIKQIHLDPYVDSVPRKKFLASDEGKRMLRLCSRRVRIGDVIYRIYYSIGGKRYDEYLFVNPATKRLVADCSFWGFTATKTAEYPIPIGDWMKGTARGRKHSARQFLRSISVTPEGKQGLMRLMSSGMRQTPVSSRVVKQTLQVTSCHFASIPVYSPKSGDDVHVAVDLVWKQVGDTVTVIAANVHLKGELARTALFAKDDDSDVRNIEYDKNQKTIFGVVSGDLCYFVGDKETRVPVLRSFDKKIE